MQQNKLFVGNLSFSTTSAELESAFSAYGAIEEVKVITDRETGRSRGFGFVTFTTQLDAETAASAMNGKELNGRSLRVNMATEKAPHVRTRSGGGGGGFGGGGGGFGGQRRGYKA